MFENRKARKHLIKDTASFIKGWLIFGLIVLPSIAAFALLIIALYTKMYTLLLYLFIVLCCYIVYVISSKLLVIILGFFYDQADKTMVYLKKNEQFVEQPTSGKLRCPYRSRTSEEKIYISGTKVKIKDLKTGEAVVVIDSEDGESETITVEIQDLDLD